MKPNLLVLPHSPDGEILNSLLRRIMSYLDSGSLLKICRQLLERQPGLDGMPSHLGEFQRVFGDTYGDIDTFIENHTEFNFYCCGLRKEKITSQRVRLISMHRGPVRLCRLPLLLGTCDGTYLECPECTEAQKKRKDSLMSTAFQVLYIYPSAQSMESQCRQLTVK
ncbi:hypothetical protein F506_20100 [Herbaspirillum hiltneri N3]|uniref:TniQ protein n=1 Tax=Herbaspirillum hiltneri N3 TaxID=1262470 RepID=A0ABN4I0V5_9BURK|nr:hypothetical protein F506_20100 [Herbaspirillum hiltneri N3]